MNDKEALKVWQESDLVHPLTCRVDSTHGDLVVEGTDDEPTLRCEACGYVQTYIPYVATEAPKAVERGELTPDGLALGNIGLFRQDAPRPAKEGE